jgi:hypothetical protein
MKKGCKHRGAKGKPAKKSMKPKKKAARKAPGY